MLSEVTSETFHSRFSTTLNVKFEMLELFIIKSKVNLRQIVSGWSYKEKLKMSVQG